jgi:hypothetical protein
MSECRYTRNEARSQSNSIVAGTPRGFLFVPRNLPRRASEFRVGFILGCLLLVYYTVYYVPPCRSFSDRWSLSHWLGCVSVLAVTVECDEKSVADKSPDWAHSLPPRNARPNDVGCSSGPFSKSARRGAPPVIWLLFKDNAAFTSWLKWPTRPVPCCLCLIARGGCERRHLFRVPSAPYSLPQLRSLAQIVPQIWQLHR